MSISAHASQLLSRALAPYVTRSPDPPPALRPGKCQSVRTTILKLCSNTSSNLGSAVMSGTNRLEVVVGGLVTGKMVTQSISVCLGVEQACECLLCVGGGLLCCLCVSM